MVFPFSAKTHCLIAILMVLGQRSDAAVLLGTDFSDRTASGATASNLTYTLNGFANPGDLTALKETPEDSSRFAGLFDTFRSYNYFAVDRNVGNEGPWSVDVPLVLTVAQLQVDSIYLDWQDFDNFGNFQSAGRDKIYTATLRNSSMTQLALKAVQTASATSGQDTLTFDAPVLLTNSDTYILNIRAEHGSNASGNNTGLDAFEIRGTTIPEPSSILLFGLGGLVLLRRRR